MFHKGNWESAHENSACGTAVEDTTSGLVHEGLVWRVTLCKRDRHTSMQNFASGSVSPTRYDFSGNWSTDGWRALLNSLLA